MIAIATRSYSKVLECVYEKNPCQYRGPGPIFRSKLGSLSSYFFKICFTRTDGLKDDISLKEHTMHSQAASCTTLPADGIFECM